MPPLKYEAYPTIKIGPSKLPVNGKIWESIANNRILPSFQSETRPSPIMPTMSLPVSQPSFYNSSNLFGGYVSWRSDFFSSWWWCNFSLQNHPPPFEDDFTRNMVFTRDFGPVAHPSGFIELRLRENIRWRQNCHWMSAVDNMLSLSQRDDLTRPFHLHSESQESG